MSDSYKIVKEPRERVFIHDAMWISRKKGLIYGVKEYDITEWLAKIKAYRREHNVQLSFSNYLIWCFAKTLAEMPQANAYRDWRGRVYQMKNVDIFHIMLFDKDGEKVLLPRIFKNVNKKSAVEYENEVQKVISEGYKLTPEEEFFMKLPRFLRRLLLQINMLHPPWFKLYFGTAGATSLLLGGLKDYIGIPKTQHTSSLTICSRTKKML